MFLSKIHRAYIIFGILLYAILFAYWDNSFTWFNLVNIIVFTSYTALLSMCLHKEESFYSEARIILITLLYSLFFVGIYLWLSEYYRGNTFLFSEIDARIYEKTSVMLCGLHIDEWIHYLKAKHWAYDDWGAPITMALMLKIVPVKLFINFCYILMNTYIALCLFRIGKMIMIKCYAFIASLSYSISSYSLFFMGSGLKEITMVFLVVVSVYLLYRYWEYERLYYLINGGLISLLIIFFRPPIAIFIWCVYAIFLLKKTNSNLIRLILVTLAISVFLVAFNLIQYSADRYAHGGAITESYMFTSTSLFQKLTLYAGALIGPFPQLLQIDEQLTYKSLFGAGLLYKFLLFLPFWKGLVYSFKSKAYEVYPIFLFVLLEMLGLAIALDGLELRKAMPHVPLFILGAFWFLNKYDEDADEIIQQTPYYVWTRREFMVSTCFVLFATIMWNIFK